MKTFRIIVNIALLLAGLLFLAVGKTDIQLGFGIVLIGMALQGFSRAV